MTCQVLIGCGGWDLSKCEVWAVGGTNAQDPQGWKRPWGLCRMGLRLKEQKRPRHAPHPWSQRAGNLTWEPSRLPVSEWVRQTPSSPLPPLVWEGPSCLPLLISPASLLCPQGPMWPGGGFGGQGISLGAQQAPQARVGQAIALRSSPALPREPLPPASPDFPGLRGANPVWPPLLLPPSVPLHPTGSLWGSSHLLGCQSPPPAAGRHPSCGETLTPCLPTPPS